MQFLENILDTAKELGVSSQSESSESIKISDIILKKKNLLVDGKQWIFEDNSFISEIVLSRLGIVQ